jgi:hypothetical protein
MGTEEETGKSGEWGQGESVCGYVGVGGKERVQGFK